MGFDLDQLPTRDGMYLRDAVGGEIKDVDDSNHTVVAVFPHDTVDTFKTTFDKDAFRESFDSRRPLMCWQHDLRDPIGHSVKAQVLPGHNEIVGQFDNFDAVPNAKRAFHQIQSGTITDFSFGFRQPKYEKHSRFAGVRNIRSAIMMEFSPVSVGSIPGAVATGIREEEIVMAEHTAAEIAELVRAQVISPEEGRAMLAEMDSYRQHISVRSPEQTRIAELEAQLSKGAAAAPVSVGADIPSVETLTAKVEELELALADSATRAAEAPDADAPATEEYVVPAVVNAETILDALPDPLQRWMIEQEAVLAIGPEGTRFFSEDDEAPDENARAIAEAVATAHASALDWIKDTTRDDLPEEVQQALLLVDAAATSTRALLEVLDPDGERAGASPYHQPGNPDGSENMGPTKVKCLTCRGTGEAPDGKTCPDCDGSGMVAVTRGEGTAIVNPDGTVRCPSCLGLGKRANGDDCRTCGGKGNLPGNEGHSGSPNKRSDGMDVRFVSEDDRREMAKKGIAMENGDFPIPDKGHLQSALGHFGNYTGDKTEARSHIEKRAKALGVDLDEGDFGNRAEFDGDGDDADKPGADSTAEHHGDTAKRLQQQALGRLNKHAKKKVGKGEPDGGHPDLDKESVEGMPAPLNHTP